MLQGEGREARQVVMEKREGETSVGSLGIEPNRSLAGGLPQFIRRASRPVQAFFG